MCICDLGFILSTSNICLLVTDYDGSRPRVRQYREAGQRSHEPGGKNVSKLTLQPGIENSTTITITKQIVHSPSSKMS